MSYVKRDENLKVVSVVRWPDAQHTEQLAGNHPDIVAFENPPPFTDTEIDAQMDAKMDAPFIKSLIEGIANFQAPGQPADLRSVVKTRGRDNMPRGRM